MTRGSKVAIHKAHHAKAFSSGIMGQNSLPLKHNVQNDLLFKQLFKIALLGPRQHTK